MSVARPCHTIEAKVIAPWQPFDNPTVIPHDQGDRYLERRRPGSVSANGPCEHAGPVRSADKWHVRTSKDSDFNLTIDNQRQ